MGPNVPRGKYLPFWSPSEKSSLGNCTEMGVQWRSKHGLVAKHHTLGLFTAIVFIYLREGAQRERGNLRFPAEHGA